MRMVGVWGMGEGFGHGGIIRRRDREERKKGREGTRNVNESIEGRGGFLTSS